MFHGKCCKCQEKEGIWFKSGPCDYEYLLKKKEVLTTQPQKVVKKFQDNTTMVVDEEMVCKEFGDAFT